MLGAASATRRAASARPRAPSEINVGIEAFSRRASSAASPSSASQALTARPRICVCATESIAESGIRSSIESEASASDSLMRSARSARTRSSSSDRRRQLANEHTASTIIATATTKAAKRTISTGRWPSSPSNAGSTKRQMHSAPKPNAQAQYRQMRPCRLNGRCE